ncbi:uncharacterized protein LOC142328863 [Lycorma delicatula]|uniref:uncharacterized protein LOC142328863 n=1 Tax=Lycorma delicatula TaxID=130591 RepID=UPI003F50EC1C
MAVVNMDKHNLPLFGVELENIHFDGVFDWLISVKPIDTFWNAQPTYIIVQIIFTIGALSTLIHAFRNGGRWPYLWLGTILHGLVVEAICYIHPDVDNFWHSQTPIIFLGRRLPLHIIFLYPCFIYQASAAVNKLKLPWWAEPVAVGATVVLIDMPYDITCVKFVHWSWHDTDPNIEDRHYWVPWNSYYFHCTFATSFTFWFHYIHYLYKPSNKKWQSSGIRVEIMSMLIASLLGAPGGILMFLPIYHPLHDIAGIHSEVTFFTLFSIVLLIVWSGDRIKTLNSIDEGVNDGTLFTKLLVFSLIMHYSVFLLIVIFGKPENEISIGLHEPTGPCNVTVQLHTALGMILHKRKYLCVDDYDEDYFDFSCAPSGPPKGIANWYTICGKPFKNRSEYITVIGTICVVATLYFYNTHHNKKDLQCNNCIKKHQ